MNFETPVPDLQISFHEQLGALRSCLLLEALLVQVAESDIPSIDQELRRLVAKNALRRVAGWGMRGEIAFPVPALLEGNPRLLGYYRLLLGFSQKEFYGKPYGFGPFRGMEERGKLSERLRPWLEDLCRTLCASGEYFVNAIDELSRERAHELSLLTLGAQLRGGALNRYGAQATRAVFDLIKTLVERHIVASGKEFIEIENAAGDPIRIAFATDPDIAVHAELPSKQLRPILAIEIKGGRDYSNIHNRIGEAEKSHQKARAKGFTECWTIVGVDRLDLDIARRESPTTNRFFALPSISKPATGEHAEFREQIHSRLGIRD